MRQGLERFYRGLIAKRLSCFRLLSTVIIFGKVAIVSMADLQLRIWDNVPVQDLVPTGQDLEGFVRGLARSEIEKNNENISPPLRYEAIFTDGDLSLAGLLVRQHSFGKIPSAVKIVDSLGDRVYPDNEEDLTISTVSISLSSFRPLIGQWKIILGG